MYKDENVMLFNGDCLEVMDKMIEKGIKVDLTVTSPPYDDMRSYNGNNTSWNESVWKSAIEKLFSITKQGGIVVWIVGDKTKNGSETGTSFKQALYAKEIGFKLYDTMIYQKRNYIPLNHRRYEQSFEYMFIFAKGKPNTFNAIRIPCKNTGRLEPKRTFYKKSTDEKPSLANTNKAVKKDKIKPNIWDMVTNSNIKGHPAPFPLSLPSDHIKSWSNENDLVLDCFMGSGTTGVACKNLNRKFIGIELDEKYFEIAKKRITEQGGE